MARALLDTNVLVHAANVASPLHAAAALLVARGLSESDHYCIAPQNLTEFAAVVTNARFVEKPLPPADVLRMVQELYQSRRLTKIYPKRGTVMRAARTGADKDVHGAVWYDLFLAETMRDAGVHLIVTENVTDFHPFPFITAKKIQEAV